MLRAARRQLCSCLNRIPAQDDEPRAIRSDRHAHDPRTVPFARRVVRSWVLPVLLAGAEILGGGDQVPRGVAGLDACGILITLQKTRVEGLDTNLT